MKKIILINLMTLMFILACQAREQQTTPCQVMQTTTFSFIENGVPETDIKRCGKYFGSEETVNKELWAKRTTSNYRILGSRLITPESKFDISAAFSGRCQFFIGGTSGFGFELSSPYAINFNDGNISGSRGLKIKDLSTTDPIRLNIKSTDEDEVEIRINDALLFKDKLKCDGYFGFRIKDQNIGVKISSFNATISNSEPVQFQSTRPMSRMGQSHTKKVHTTASNAKKCHTLFLGDSITDAFDGDAGFLRGKLSRSGATVWKTFKDPVNAGVGSDRTMNLLWRVRNMPLKKLNPKNIVVLIGINNVISGNRADAIELGIRAIVEHVEKELPDSNIVLQTIFPTRSTLPVREAVNKALLSGKWAKNTKVVNFDPAMSDKTGLIRREFTFDSAHLIIAGFQAWADELKKHLK